MFSLLLKQSSLDVVDNPLETEVRSLQRRLEETETNRVDYTLYIEKKLQEQEKKFEKRLIDCQNTTLTKLYYFRSFRWRILRNKENTGKTQVSYLSFIQDIDSSGLNSGGKGYSTCSFRKINVDFIKTNAKITYNGILDDVVYFDINNQQKNPILTENKQPVIYIRFPEPIQLKEFSYNAVMKMINQQYSGAEGTAPEEWIFEGSNDECVWTVLCEKKETQYTPYGAHTSSLRTCL